MKNNALLNGKVINAMKRFSRRGGKCLAFLMLLLSFTFGVMANPVDIERARQVATTFLYNNGVRSTELREVSAIAGLSNMYVFTTENSFVLLPVDDRVQPILGYSLTGGFVTENMPDNVKWWFQSYSDQIQYVIEHLSTPKQEVAQQWQALTCGTITTNRLRTVVGPLITTTWNQGYPYNNLCPHGSITGCVATAMAQILKYWNYPQHGIGWHSYTPYSHPEYGELTADFNDTYYDWINMTNTYDNTSTNTQQQAVATLMYHCGVSVNMDYSPTVSGAGSSNALMDYFNYSSEMQQISRSDFSDDEWVSMMLNEMNAYRPVFYRGDEGSGGHAFVCDGYDSGTYNNYYFHFNWGWGGWYDGYFSINSMNPGGSDFNYHQAMTIGIRPSANNASPTGLSCSQNERNVTLNWTSASGAVSYNVYCNMNLVGNVITNSFTYTAPYGESKYYVRSVDSNGELSLSSNSVSVNVTYPVPVVDDLSATLSGNNVSLSWTTPEWCYPQTPSATLTYGNGNYENIWGYNGTTTMYWGHRYPAADLSSYDNLAIYKISFYANEMGEYQLYVYQGTSSGRPRTLVWQQSFSVGLIGWFDIDLSNIVQIDATQDLWVFIHDPEARNWPATGCWYSGGDSNYYSYSAGPTSWIGTFDDVAFLIRTYITDGTYTYNLYRNGISIANNVSSTRYRDNNLATGGYNYYIKTNYYAGETNASNQVSVQIGTGTYYTVSASAYPTEGGMVTGMGSYLAGQTCTLNATANDGYSFVNWTNNGAIVSNSSNYSFNVNSDLALAANFENIIEFADANVKAICVDNWDTNGDGKISYSEAAMVTDLGNVFQNNAEITSFEELQYFVGLTSIADYAFYGCSNLTGSLIIPNSVTTIGCNAFTNCSGLTGDLVIPENINVILGHAFKNCGFTSIHYNAANCQSIGYDYVAGTWYNAFENNTSLGEIVVGDNVTQIPAHAFEYTYAHNCQLTIGNSVQTINNNAFYNNGDSYTTGLSGNLVFPATLTTIGDNAFSYNYNLSGDLELPTSLITIGNNVFNDCLNLTGILTIPENVTWIGMRSFVNCRFSEIHFNAINCESMGWDENHQYIYYVFWLNSNLQKIVIGENVTQIPDYAFGARTSQNCQLIFLGNSVTRIGNYAFIHDEENDLGLIGELVIPTSVTEIGNYAFYGCAGLAEIWSNNTTAPLIQNNTFYGVNRTIPVHVPCGSHSSYQNASYWSEFINYSENSHVLIVRTNNELFGTVTVVQHDDCTNNVCIVQASPNVGTFVNWTTPDGEVVSTDATYTFTITQDMVLIANFSSNELTVYDDIATNNYVPVNGLWCDAYLKCEYVMPATDLTEMSGSNINAMTYYLSTPASDSWGAAHFLVFLKEVDFTSIDAYQGMNGATLVYEGPLDGTQPEMNIFFSTPYHYNGGNLLIGVYNIEKGSYKSVSFYGKEVNGASVQGFSSNSLEAVSCNQRNFLPKTSFYYMPDSYQQSITLQTGWNWFSTNIEITLYDLKSALLEALPGTTISIKSQTQNTSYNPNLNRWVGSLAWDVAKMYMIKVVAPCEITFEGLPINLVEHPVSILNGANWIGFPLNSSMTLSNAFAGFAINGDKIKSQTNNALYNGIRWQGQLNTLEPGKGYIYISNSSEGKVFTFPTSAK